MKIDYATHYDAAYWQQQKTYRDQSGIEHVYGGPSLRWDGFQHVADALNSILPKGTLLDIGCGGGDLMARLQLHDFDVYGVDVSEYAVKNGRTGLANRQAIVDITTCPPVLNGYKFFEYFPATFTNVISTDLLEHIYETDLDATFDWIKNKCDECMFFLIAITNDEEFVHTKGEEIPLHWEATAIAGHVNVRKPSYWSKFFKRHGLIIDWNRMYLFQAMREQVKPWQATAGWDHPSTWVVKPRR